ncbi:MAG: pitrilysin family protein [Planctomycetota bacterium]|nr:pitrilysin family protein [Planctomycetota bacterium]
MAETESITAPDISHIHRLSNGMTLVAEPMPWLRSAAFTLLVPAGTRSEPEGLQGLCSMTLDLAQRGAGRRNSRQIVEDLDFMGIERSSSCSTFHTSFSVACVAESLNETLGIYADIVLRPHMPEDEVDESRQTALQELLSIEDDPSQKVFTQLKNLRYGAQFGRSPYGSTEGLESVQLQDMFDYHVGRYIPDGAILAVAGKFEWGELKGMVDKLFGDWQSTETTPPGPVPIQTGVQHLQHESSQTHIALAYDCVPYQHPDFYQSRGLISVLSDGMSSRLFSEVREKRGLVYTVSASCQTIGDQGSVLTYAGTTGPRAQETLDVTIETIKSLGNGITEGELSRLKARVKSSLVMEQESSTSRSSQIATDWYYLKRVPNRKQVLAEIESLTCESLLVHFQQYPPTGWGLVTMGPEPVVLAQDLVRVDSSSTGVASDDASNGASQLPETAKPPAAKGTTR